MSFIVSQVFLRRPREVILSCWYPGCAFIVSHRFVPHLFYSLASQRASGISLSLVILHRRDHIAYPCPWSSYMHIQTPPSRYVSQAFDTVRVCTDSLPATLYTDIQIHGQALCEMCVPRLSISIPCAHFFCSLWLCTDVSPSLCTSTSRSTHPQPSQSHHIPRPYTGGP